jgi:hypothetical protein
MRIPALVDDHGGALETSYGLGQQIMTAGRHRLAGHYGAMPGFVAAVFVDPEARIGVVTAANTTYGGDRDLVNDLLAIVRDAEPRVADEWAPAPLPANIGLELLGTWCWGPNAFVLKARQDGLLELEGRGETTRFEPDGDAWVGLDGYLAGERLHIDPDGRFLEIATFVFTRGPYGDGPVPGGVDPEGWTTA